MPGGTGPCACLDGCGACDSCGRWLCVGGDHVFVGDSCRECGLPVERTCRHLLEIDSGRRDEINRCGKPATHVSAGRVDLCAEHATKYEGSTLIEPQPEDESEPYEGSFCEAADNEGARIAAADREDPEEL